MSTTLISYETYSGILQSSKKFIPDMDNKSGNTYLPSKLLDQISYAPTSANPTTLFTGDADKLVSLQTSANSSISGYIANVQTLVNTLQTSLVAVADVTFLHNMINGDPQNLIYNQESGTVLGVSIAQAGGLKEAVAQACTTTSGNTFASKLMSALKIIKQSAVAYQTFANDLSVVISGRPADISNAGYSVTFPACIDIQNYWIKTMNNAIFSTTESSSFTKNLNGMVSQLISPSQNYTSNTAIGVLIDRMMTNDPNYLLYLSNLDNLYLCAKQASNAQDFAHKAIPILTKFYNNLMNTHLVHINNNTTSDQVVNSVQGWINIASDYVTYLDIKLLIWAITGYYQQNREFDNATGFVTSYPVIADTIKEVDTSLNDIDNFYYDANDNVTIAILVPDIKGDDLGFFPVHEARVTDYQNFRPNRNFMKLTNCSIPAFDSLNVPVNFFIEPGSNNPYLFVSMFSGIELFMTNNISVNDKLHSMDILPQQRSIQSIMPWNVWDLNLLLIHSLLLVTLMEHNALNTQFSDLAAYSALASTLQSYNGTFQPISFTQALLTTKVNNQSLGADLYSNINSNILITLSQAVTSIEIIATICAYLRQSTSTYQNFSYSTGLFDTKNSPILASNIRSIGEQFNVTY
jgi:hypothetical protein